MALIKCTECGKEITDKAEECENCGCRIEKQNYNKFIYENYSKIELSKNEENGKKVFQKMYYLLILNNIKCSKPSDINDWKKIVAWSTININSMKKIKLEHVIKYSPDKKTANKDYNEYQKFIDHFVKLRSISREDPVKKDKKQWESYGHTGRTYEIRNVSLSQDEIKILFKKKVLSPEIYSIFNEEMGENQYDEDLTIKKIGHNAQNAGILLVLRITFTEFALFTKDFMVIICLGSNYKERKYETTEILEKMIKA